MIKNLWHHLSHKRKTQFFLLLILMIISAVMEIVSIGAVIPFLSVLTAPEKIYQHDLAQPIIQILQITDASQLLLPLTILFISLTIISATIRLFLLYVSTRLSYSTGADISIDIYRRTLYQDYLIHTSRNSSEIISGIITKTNIITSNVLVPLLFMISSCIISLCIVTVVFIVNPQIAMGIFITVSFLYGSISFFAKKTLKENSQLIANHDKQRIKSLQDGLGAIRDVLIDKTQELYCKMYRNSDLLMRKAQGDNFFIASSPRFIIEGIIMVLIVILAYFITLEKGSITFAIPTLGLLAISAQKLLPLIQQSYSSYSMIKGSRSSISDILNLLDQPLPSNFYNDLATSFKKEIIFNNVSFRYSKDTRWIIKNASLRFKKGETIGIIGSTGSGKSTLIDILMGLLQPTSGELLIDDVVVTPKNKGGWQKYISHVPQNIYLVDGTVKENIAFGKNPELINDKKVIMAARRAQMSEVIYNFKDKYEAFVGERGVKLSGGQRQRLGVARALYKESEVLILDEATSALDSQTEQKLMHEISQTKYNQTIFIIAHRTSTLKNCDSIYRLNNDHTIKKVDFNQI
jgi:ATP-binding cassette, subfamily B, bacterial PglK